MSVVDIVVSSLLGVVGLYFTHSLRRQQSLRVAQQRLVAYGALWELTEVARRTRFDPADGSGPLTRPEAQDLFRDMAAWYYHAGNGMFLTGTATELYTAVRTNLSVYAMSDDEGGAERCMRDLSLFRQQMRLDLKTLSGRPSYWKEFNDGDRRLLKSARIDNPHEWGLPWYRTLLRPTGRRSARAGGVRGGS